MVFIIINSYLVKILLIKESINPFIQLGNEKMQNNPKTTTLLALF